MKKMRILLMLIVIIFGLNTQKIHTDAGDVLGPTIAGAALGGAFGGGRGAAIGAGVGFGIGALNSAERDRARVYYEPYDDDENEYYYDQPVRTRKVYRTRRYYNNQPGLRNSRQKVIYVD